MTPLSLALAVATITAPESVPVEQPPCPLWALQTVSLSLELLDPREVKYYFQGPQFQDWDLKNIRERYREFGDAPPLVDADRFPGLELCRDMRAWNREYVEWLDTRACLYPNEAWIADAIGECNQLYAVWDCVADVKTEYYYVCWKRRSLKKLREAIGPQMYYAGCLPAPVPVWRYRRSD